MEDNVIPLGGRSHRLSELEAMQVRVRVLCAYLDANLDGWREDIAVTMEAALRG